MSRYLLAVFVLVSQTIFGTYAVVTAIPTELECVKSKFNNPKKVRIDGINYYISEVEGKTIVLCCSGYGTTNVTATVTHLIQQFKPKGVIFCGVAGGIDPSLKSGNIVLGEKAFEVEIQGLHEALKDTPFTQDSLHPSREEGLPTEFLADKQLLQYAASLTLPFPVQKGTIATAQTYPAPKDLFTLILERDSKAIDMESSAVYQTCWIFHTPALVIRGISNMLSNEGDDQGGYTIGMSIENASQVLTALLEILPE